MRGSGASIVLDLGLKTLRYRRDDTRRACHGRVARESAVVSPQSESRGERSDWSGVASPRRGEAGSMRNEDRATPVVAKRAVRGFCDFTARDAKWFSANDSSLREKRTQKLKRRRATRRIVEAFRRARSFRVRNVGCSVAGMKSRFFAVFRPDRRRCRAPSRIRRERWSEA